VLLGLPEDGNDERGIEEAAKRRMDRLDRFALSPDADVRAHVQQMMNEVAHARNVLLEQHRTESPAPQREAPGKADAPVRQELPSPEPDFGTAGGRKRIRLSFNTWLIVGTVLLLALLLIPLLSLPSRDDGGIETAARPPDHKAVPDAGTQRLPAKQPTTAPVVRPPDSQPVVTPPDPPPVAKVPTPKEKPEANIPPEKVLTLDLGGSVSMKLVRIPAGKFMMGSPAEEKDRGADEHPRREVTISRPFYLGFPR